MADERKRSRRWPWVVVAMLVLYVLGTGPVAALNANGFFDNAPQWLRDDVNAIYSPLYWLAEKSRAFGLLYLWYISLWK